MTASASFKPLLASEALCGSLPLVCPRCHAALRAGESSLLCTDCGADYQFADGFPDLIVGERFEDETTSEKMAYEENSNADLTNNYLLPLFRKLWPSGNARLLSLGCGTGVDVDLVNAAGFECIGIECGKRAAVWKNREQKHRLLLANGKRLPFSDATFDAVFCGCVFPHVGVVGDSSVTAHDCYAQRLSLAKDMSRVLTPDGYVLVSSPNRHFPLDLFHGRGEGRLAPKVNWPTSRFLLSVSDYAAMFREAGCLGPVRSLPVTNYWGFIRSRRSLKGFVLGLPVRSLFWATSNFSLLRGSFIDPWLVVLIQKSA